MLGIFRKFKINRVIRSFIISDLVLFSGWGLISPVFPIFIKDQIAGATITTIGTAVAIYWIVRSLTEVPLATLLDKIRGEKDDFYTLVGGLVLSSVTAFLYVFVKDVTQLYIVEAFHALAFSFYAPSWAGIFSRHLDKEKMAISWSLDHTFLGVASGITGYLGSLAVQRFGYSFIFIAAAALSLIAAIIIFLVPDIILPSQKRLKSVPDVGNHSVKSTTHE